MTKDQMRSIEEALDLALEALIYASSYCDTYDAIDAITAIKQARALDKMADNARELGLDYEPYKSMSAHIAQATSGRVQIDPVTGDVGIGTIPAPAAPVQEPLTDEHIERIYHRYGGNMINCARAIERAVSAAQRKWVGLTDRERDQFFKYATMTDLVKAIETKLKEKNT